MIRHLFKIIWNERKSNGWIVLEYVVVFCLLWFCCDYLFFIGKSYSEPLGFDISNTFYITMQKGSVEEKSEDDSTTEEYITYTATFIERVKRYPGVEYISFSHQGVPYAPATSSTSVIFGRDSLNEEVRVRWVTSEFFDVFKVPVQSGRIFNSEDVAETDFVVISPDRHNRFGKYPGATASIHEIKSLYNAPEQKNHPVVGIAGKVKDTYFEPYKSNVYYTKKTSDIQLEWSQIAIRVSPQATAGFAERFSKEMREQLNIGPYFLSSIVPLEKIKANRIKRAGINDRLNSVYAIMAFLIMNIFLGVIGTFWYRTQARKSEIGLRMAMGSTARQVKILLFQETLLLLFVSSIIGINICFNISGTDILKMIDIPIADRTQLATGFEQSVIVYLLTFSFLAIVSLLAVWYPVRQASSIPPSEALHAE
ncbi:FtsX-like permease family protein [Parabacteroides sp. PF5-9]|uniref:ABC transporter permease n=1 Tax=Parabacteroides sp. PF5-9 TaxID=1742404 RepID=UPI002474FC9B|nr:FtsX-like permease family protein [Parabacteroides sp. PF5-9]MDH6357959.1 putative ABC transport system permease protein [Parabacteroides sp. PF5-9]